MKLLVIKPEVLEQWRHKYVADDSGFQAGYEAALTELQTKARVVKKEDIDYLLRMVWVSDTERQAQAIMDYLLGEEI